MLLLLSSISSFGAEPRLVRVGAFNYYPGIFKDTDGAVKGFYVDALSDIAKRENIRFEYVYGSWNEGLEKIRSGEVDLLTSVAYTPERELFMDYSKTPLLTVWGELYAPLSSDIDGILQIKGKKVAVMKSDFNAKHFIELVKKFDISCEFIEMPGFDDVFRAVAEKKVDAGVANNTYGAAKQKEFGLKSTGVVFNPFDIFFTVARGKNNDLLHLLDGYLDEWQHQEDSVYNKARQKWSHGAVGSMTIIPRWLINATALLAIIVFAAVFFILLLRRQVGRAIHDLHHRETVLNESRNRYQVLFAGAGEGILILSPNGQFVDVNESFARMHGYSKVEMMQMSLKDLDTPESSQMVPERMRMLQDGKNLNFEVSHYHKDGHVFNLGVSASLISCGGSSYIQCFHRDITERKTIEEVQTFLATTSISTRHEPFFHSLARYLAEKLDMDFVCIDILEGDGLTAQTLAVWCDGHFEDNVTYDLKDTPCGDVVGKDVCCFPSSVCQFFPRDQVLQELKAESYVGITLFSNTGQPIGLIAVIGRKPLHNRALAEQILKMVAVRAAGELQQLIFEKELMQSEKKYRSLFEDSRDMIFISTYDGRFIDVNPAGVELLRYPSKEALMSVAIRDTYADSNDRSRFLSLLSEHDYVADFVTKLQRKDGQQIEVSISASTVKNDLGNVTAIRGIIRDITEHRKIEDQLRQSQKMESIGTLAGGVAHDFNNILTAIIGYGQLAVRKMEPDNPYRANIENMLEAADKAAYLTQGLLSFSRKQMSNRNQVELNELLKKTEMFLRRVIGEDIEFRTNLHKHPIMISADSNQIDQILMNLATNARDAMPKGGVLTITTDQVQIDEEFTRKHGYGTPGSYGLISVSDTGMGMTEVTRQRIFEPFFTTKEVGKGTGLGLAIIYGIIKQHDGYIDVYSEPGEGTTFRLYLPLIEVVVKESAMAEESKYPARGTETILLAEDDYMLRKLSKTVLEEFGYVVIEAVDGEDAISKFADNKDRIDLFLTDLIMPKKSGKEAYDEIRKIRPDIKTIFASGYSPDIVQDKASLGDDAIIVFKPITPMDLLRKVREVLDKRDT